MTDLGERLDEPILSVNRYRQTAVSSKSSSLFKNTSLIGSLFSETIKTLAVIAVITVLLSSLSSKFLSPIMRMTTHMTNVCCGKFSKLKSKFETQTEGIPMTFDDDDSKSQGWGVCTFSSKSQIGRSKYIQYDFSLPTIFLSPPFIGWQETALIGSGRSRSGSRSTGTIGRGLARLGENRWHCNKGK